MKDLKNPGDRERTSRPLLVTQHGYKRAARDRAVSSKRAERSFETRSRILDAAEELFSRHGIYGVTLRDIASLAEVDTALLHYYFDSKRGIFDAVLARRASVLNYECTDELARYEEEAGDRITVEGAIAAYLRPVFKLNRTGGRAWRNYCALITQLNNSPDWGAEAIATYFDPLARRLIEVLKHALPYAADTDLYWCYHMFARVLTVANAPGERLERLSGGTCRAGDFDALEPRMVRFVADGFRAVCMPPESTTKQ